MLGLFSFSGRTTRLGYLGVGFLQLTLLIGMVILAVAMGLGVSGGKPSGTGLMASIAVIFFGLIFTLWIGLACTARRLRDMGWPVLYGFIGLVVINVVARLFITPFTFDLEQSLPKPAAWAISTLVASTASIILTLWPSARRANFDDIEEIFGGDEREAEFEPLTGPDAQPAFGRNFGAQPGFSRIDPSQPRTQFGLRGVT